MDNTLRIAGIVEESIVDGPGIRYVIFMQGCKHNCQGCHNPKTHSFNGGYEIEKEAILDQIKDNILLDGVTLSGGEPFEQADKLLNLVKEVKKLGLNIISYTGYTFEQLIKGSEKNNSWGELLEQIDYLIDGKFVQERKTYQMKFRGSTNQRIINVKDSLKIQKTIEVEF